jgi:hypothetical protein
MPDRVRDACEASFADHKDDCSGFVRAVDATRALTLARPGDAAQCA